MHRFFIAVDEIDDNLIEIDRQQSHHMEKVLRLKTGDKVILFDGRGNEYTCILCSRRNDALLAKIESSRYHPNEPSVSVTLAQAIAKGEKMEYIIKKAVEIGASAIIPFVSERTVVTLDEKKALHKTGRWQALARETCKQCRRNTIPLIKPVVSLNLLLPELQDKRAIMLHEGEDRNSLKAVIKEFKSIAPLQDIGILVGPEGGFTPREVEAARKHSVIPAGLGPRILRTETAGLVAISIILYEGGDLG